MYDFLIDDIEANDSEDHKSAELQGKSWPILIVDDEPAIHSVTKFALEDEGFEGRPFSFLSAFDAQEAKSILSTRADIALVLLDVVMETDSAGLDLAAWIREELGNKMIRIVLRTGQPGQAPEQTVIVNYDIFDYKNKTELTAQKLFSCVISGLRSYRDVSALVNQGSGLRKVVASSGDLFKRRYIGEFSTGILQQLTSLLYFDPDAALINSCPDSSMGFGAGKVIAAIGQYDQFVGREAALIVSEKMLQRWLDSDENVLIDTEENKILISFQTQDKFKTMACLHNKAKVSEDDIELIELFVQNVAIAQERLRFWRETEETLNEMIAILSQTVENHSKQSGQYFTSVTKIAVLLAKKHGLVLKKNLAEKSSMEAS